MYGDILSKTGEWVNSDTGSVVSGRMIIKRQHRNSFSIVYDSMDELYNKIMNRKDTRVVNYIIRNMDTNNQLHITTRNLSNKVGVSQAHVVEILKLLRDNDLIKTSTAHIMVNPKWRNKKNENGEKKLCIQYITFDKELDKETIQEINELNKKYVEMKNFAHSISK